MCNARREHTDRGQLFALRHLRLGSKKLLRSLRHFVLQCLHQVPHFLAGLMECGCHLVKGSGNETEFITAAHRNGLIQFAAGHILGASFEISQWQVDQTLQQQTNGESKKKDEADRNADDVNGMRTHRLIHLVKRISNVDHAQHRLIGRMLMT